MVLQSKPAILMALIVASAVLLGSSMTHALNAPPPDPNNPQPPALPGQQQPQQPLSGQQLVADLHEKFEQFLAYVHGQSRRSSFNPQGAGGQAAQAGQQPDQGQQPTIMDLETSIRATQFQLRQAIERVENLFRHEEYKMQQAMVSLQVTGNQQMSNPAMANEYRQMIEDVERMKTKLGQQFTYFLQDVQDAKALANMSSQAGAANNASPFGQQHQQGAGGALPHAHKMGGHGEGHRSGRKRTKGKGDKHRVEKHRSEKKRNKRH